MARFFQYHPDGDAADAAAPTINGLHRFLRHSGHTSLMICSDVAAAATGTDFFGLSRFSGIVWRPDDFVVLHHSSANPDLATVLSFPARKLLVYHHITPPHFFHDAGLPEHGAAADEAHQQLRAIARSVEAAVADGDWGRRELAAHGTANRSVIPGFYDDGFYRSPELDWPIYEEVKTAAPVNIVFAGRLGPEQRIERLIETAAQYRELFGREARLHLAGTIVDEGYTAALFAAAARMRMLASLRLHPSPQPLLLKTLLAAADAFVCLGDDEGFAAPVLAAFASGCPVIARRGAAVGEVMGDAGLAIDDPEPALVAGLIDLLRRDRQARLSIQRGQSRRAMQFRTEAIERRWREFLQREFDVPFASATC